MADPPSPAPRAGDGEVLGSLEGLHGVRIPVTDALVSKDWYMTVLGLEPVLDLEEEQGVVGVVLRHPTVSSSVSTRSRTGPAPCGASP